MSLQSNAPTNENTFNMEYITPNLPEMQNLWSKNQTLQLCSHSLAGLSNL